MILDLRKSVFVDDIGASFVEFVSHRFSIAVQNFYIRLLLFYQSISYYHEKVEVSDFYRSPTQIHSICSKNNKMTHWSSAVCMLKHLLELNALLLLLKITDKDIILATIPVGRDIERLCSSLSQLYKVINVLQRHDTATADVRCLFDTLIE